MLTDGFLYFGTAVALDADANLTNPLDMLVADHQLGNGVPLQVVIKVDVAADHTTGNEEFEFIVHTDDNSSFSSATTIASKTILYSALTAGSLHVIDIPEGVNVERYLGLRFNGTGTTPTVTITAWLAKKGSIPSDTKTYPNGYSV